MGFVTVCLTACNNFYAVYVHHNAVGKRGILGGAALASRCGGGEGWEDGDREKGWHERVS